MKNFEILGELPECDRHMKWVDVTGKMALITCKYRVAIILKLVKKCVICETQWSEAQ